MAIVIVIPMLLLPAADDNDDNDKDRKVGNYKDHSNYLTKTDRFRKSVKFIPVNILGSIISIVGTLKKTQ